MFKRFAIAASLLFFGCESSQTEPAVSCEDAPSEDRQGAFPATLAAAQRSLGKTGGVTAQKSDEVFAWKCAHETQAAKAAARFKGAKRAAVGEVVGPHGGGLAKRHFTWSIKRNYTGYTPDAVSDEDVESQLEMAISTWASVTNVSFTRVASDGEITFEWIHDLGLPIPRVVAISNSKDSNGNPMGVIPEAYGATIEFAAYNLDTNLQVQDVDWTPRGRIRQLATHELGHFLGMWHAFNDPEYGNTNNQACLYCRCTHCAQPRANDPSIMSYDYKCTGNECASYLSEYDVSVIQQKYGPNPYGAPLVELWIPGWKKHFYTNSWPEANVLTYSGFASAQARFRGMLYKDSLPGAMPLHRHYTEEAGVGPRHYYSAGKRLCAPKPMWYEGILGYVLGPREKEGSQALRLYNHYSPADHDNQLTTSATPPAGYAARGVFGHILPIGNLPQAR